MINQEITVGSKVALIASPQIREKIAVEIIELSIVMPCLNEAETLAACILKAQRFLTVNDLCGEIIVADNGSTDGSSSIAQALGARLLKVAAKGYGSALAGGLAAARGRYVVIGDADDSYDFTNLAPFLERLRAGADLVMGNRFLGGIKPGAMPPLHRYLGNPVLTFIGRLFYGNPPCRDFHCGLRGLRREAVERLNLQTTGMEFASEMIVKAALLKMQIEEVPTTLSPAGRTRSPHLRSWRDGWRHLRFLLLYSPRWLFLYPGLLLIIAGTLCAARLLLGPVQIGRVTFDVHTLLFASVSIVIGFQAVIFAVCTKVFAVSAQLLPEDARLDRWFSYLTLEGGLFAGALLITAGLTGSLYAFRVWEAGLFGELNPSTFLRIVIPAVTALMIGFQIILSSFFLSVLALKRQ